MDVEVLEEIDDVVGYMSTAMVSSSREEKWREHILREAVKLKEKGLRLARLKTVLVTGRRHQIRSMLSAVGMPIFLDSQYDVLRGYLTDEDEISASKDVYEEEKCASAEKSMARLNGLDCNPTRRTLPKTKLLTLMDESHPLESPIGELNL